MNAKKNERLTNKEINDSRNELARVVRNPTYRLYSDGKGYLPLELVPAGIQADEVFKDCKELFGWPGQSDGESDDDSIISAKRYADNATFLEALLENPGYSNDSAFSETLLEDPNVDMKAMIAALENSSEKKKHINELKNFKNWLYQKPSLDLYDNTEGTDAMYARHPALHRLYAIMPDLVEPMRELLLHIRDKHKLTAEHGADTAGFREELSLGVNADLVTAMRMAYNVAGRLLTVEDTRLQYKLATGRDASHIPKVTDAFTELTT